MYNLDLLGSLSALQSVLASCFPAVLRNKAESLSLVEAQWRRNVGRREAALPRQHALINRHTPGSILYFFPKSSTFEEYSYPIVSGIMADPFTAISLAGNIAQFIDFSCKLFSASKSIYTSKSGLSNDGEDLHTLTANLQSISGKLKPVPLQSPKSNVSDELQDLALRCDNIATELLTVLNKLALRDKHSRWDSFYAALKTTWNKGKIDEMSKRLDSYRLQLVLELQKLER